MGHSTPVSRQVPLRDLADRARAYGIPSMIVDGNDVVAVMDTVREAVAQARQGHGPILVEAKTMRMVGHAQHDSAAYVPPEMFAHWKERDPLALYEGHLTGSRLWDEATKKEIEDRINRELAEDLSFAENVPFPEPQSADQGVYCEGCHTIQPKWQRSPQELMPPESSVKAAWAIDDFGDIEPQLARPDPRSAPPGA
jgi:TPP-dependent pyruvate/acetoin dehydrogenase alpha subunit